MIEYEYTDFFYIYEWTHCRYNSSDVHHALSQKLIMDLGTINGHGVMFGMDQHMATSSQPQHLFAAECLFFVFFGSHI
jgi:hypothetical protein